MSNLTKEFREIRKKGTPWCVVRTTDYRAVIKTLSAVRYGDEKPAIVVWTCTEGPQVLEPGGNGDVSIGGKDDPPYLMFTAAADESRFPADGILFMVVPDTFADTAHTWSNPFTTQAVANLRDAFKMNHRTLVILSTDGKLPPLISDDVPMLDDPLPDKGELELLADKLVESVGLKVDVKIIGKGADFCLGMTRFIAEDTIARKLSKSKGLDIEGLMVAQRTVIEQTTDGGLSFERGEETFDDIGGLQQVKQFGDRLFTGSRPPSVIIRMEEIEKAMAGAAIGTGMGDTSGVSQDQLGVLLTTMEDMDWSGMIAVGPAGSGKSLVSKALGNTYEVPTINLDLGAMKGPLVGESERSIRKAVNVLKTFAGKGGAFFVATSNGLSVIPPELRRRFRYGVWFFDVLTASERDAVWAINLKRYGIDADQKRPADSEWVGSDIRNVCDLASRLRCSLIEASTYTIPVVKSAPDAVQKLREAAHCKFLSASVPGPYQRPEKGTDKRSVSL